MTIKWLPFIVVLLLAMVTPIVAAARPPPDKVQVINRTILSTVKITASAEIDSTLICTGFIVDNNLVLTVRHCLGSHGDTAVNGVLASIVKVSGSLALLGVKTVVGPLQIRKEPLQRGQEVISIGFGLGFLHTLTRFIAIPLYIGADVVLDGQLLPGMSGGPTVDMDGRVVGIGQSNHEGVVSLLCGQDEIRGFLK